MSFFILSVSNPGDAQGLARVERREVELELRVFDGIRGEHVRAEWRHAPLEALAEIPHLALARAPRREVTREPVGDVGEQPAAEELVRPTVGRVAPDRIAGAGPPAWQSAQARPAGPFSPHHPWASSARRMAGLFVGSRLSPKPTGFFRVNGFRSASVSGGRGPVSVWR